MISPKQVNQLTKYFSVHNIIVITTHHNPDGDALGSEIAMYQYLKFLGKTVHIINNSEIPKNYQFLNKDKEIQLFDSQLHRPLLDKADLFLFLDISDWGRLSEMDQLIKNSSAVKICVDHHHVNCQFANLDIIYEHASSTGELIFEFLKAVNFSFDKKTAIALYTCLLTDTGSFRFSNTTAATHRIASELLTMGINTKEIYGLVYEQNSRSKMALLGEALNHLNYECNGKIAWFVFNERNVCQISCLVLGHGRLFGNAEDD